MKTATPLPVVMYSHGSGGMRTNYSAICCDLASHGYLVAAIEHRSVPLCAFKCVYMCALCVTRTCVYTCVCARVYVWMCASACVLQMQSLYVCSQKQT